MTYNVFSGTLNPTHSHSIAMTLPVVLYTLKDVATYLSRSRCCDTWLGDRNGHACKKPFLPIPKGSVYRLEDNIASALHGVSALSRLFGPVLDGACPSTGS